MLLLLLLLSGFSTAATVVAMVDPRSVPLGQGGGARSAAAGLLLRSALGMRSLSASMVGFVCWGPMVYRAYAYACVIATSNYGVYCLLHVVPFY